MLVFIEQCSLSCFSSSPYFERNLSTSHILTPDFLNTNFNAIPAYLFVFQLAPIPFRSQTKMSIHFSLPVRATYSADLNILDLFTLIIFIYDYMLCNFLQSPVMTIS